MPRLQLKLIGALAGLVGVVALVSGYLAERGLRERELAAIERRLSEEAGLIVELVKDVPLEPQQSAELSALAARAAAAAGARVTLVAPDGSVVADSDVRVEDLARVENHRDRPEIRSALAGRASTSTRLSETVGRKLLYRAVPLSPDGDGVVRLAVDLDWVEAAVAALRRELIVAGTIGLVAAVALSFVLSAVLVRPLVEIRQTLNAIAGGTLGARVRRRPNDELGEIAAAVNRMAEELELRLEEITDEKEQQEAVLRGMMEGVLILDARGKIVLANRRIRELFALQGEVEGKLPLEVIRHPEVHAVLQQARASETPVLREIGFDAPQRRILQVRAVGIPVRGGRGAVAVFYDLTELQRLESVRRDFVANASHELRTPLTAIRGFAETLVASEVPEPERRKYLRVILDHAKRIDALIDDLLELSRLESETVALELERVELGPIVANVIENLSERFAERGVSTDGSKLAAPPARADRRAVEQILYNLLDNAAKYTEPGGRVEVSALRDGQFVRVTVADTGVGIPEADRARIFERFYRADKARSRELGGTGLGLSIVRHLVESLAGEIDVESTPGVGSRFSFTLPIFTET